jgi:hypothetical protein
MKKYFILDAPAIQYLQSHWYSFPSQKVINKTSWNIQEIIS